MTIDKCRTCKHAFTTGKGRFYCKKSLADKDDCGEYSVIEQLRANRTDELISKREALASIKALYPNMMPIVDYFGARRKWFEKNKPYFECENAIMSLQPAKQESKTGQWITKIKSDLGGDMWSTNPKCSECGGEPYYSNTIYNYKFCPYCGARMEIEKNE